MVPRKDGTLEVSETYYRTASEEEHGYGRIYKILTSTEGAPTNERWTCCV
jgi:hypothetical protein